MKYNFEQELVKEQHNDLVLTVAFSENGRYFASGGNDKTIKVYFSKQSQFIKQLPGH